MKSLTLNQDDFKQPIKNPPVLKPIAGIPGVSGTLPMRAGEIVLAEHEKERLKQFGWKEGDPLPGDIAQRIAKAERAVTAIRQETAVEIQAKPPQDHPILKRPPEVDISQLGKKRQEELAQYLEHFKQMAPQIEAAARAESRFSELTPGVQKALSDQDIGVKVYDSRITGVTPKEFQRQIDEAEGKTDVEENGLEDESDMVDGPSSPHPCPHCGYDTEESPLFVSDEDKLLYLASIWDTPFVKEYSLFGGRVKFVFKQLSSEHSALVLSEVSKAVRAGELDEGATTWWGLAYRMVLSLQSYTINNELTDCHDTIYQALKAKTPIGNLVQALQNTHPFSQESFWRQCKECYTKFNHLLEHLELRASDPNFWPAIGG